MARIRRRAEQRLFAPEDDLGYAAAGVGYGVSSLLRYVVLVTFVVLILRCSALRFRLRATIAATLLMIEIGYVGAAWTSSDPSGGWCLVRVATCVMSALVSGLVIKVCWPTRMPGRPAVPAFPK